MMSVASTSENDSSGNGISVMSPRRTVPSPFSAQKRIASSLKSRPVTSENPSSRSMRRLVPALVPTSSTG